MGANALWESSCRYDTYGELTASSNGTTLGVSATNTKGSWVQLSASTAFDAEGILVTIGGSVAGSPSQLIDIGIGSAGNERIVVPDLLISNRLGHPQSIWLPIRIKGGSRLAARAQSTATANVPKITVTIMSANPSGLPGFDRMTAYGIATGDSGGTNPDPGGTANTKGSYTQIVASTTNEMKAMLLALSARANSAMTDAGWLFDFAIGAGGSERIVLPDQWAGAQTASDVITPSFVGPIACSIPAGTRLAVRCQSSITDATDRLLDTAWYGFD